MRLYEFTEQQVTEVAPPGMEDWINDRKAEFKKRYGDKWQQVLYATAWKQHNESLGEAAPTAVRAVGGVTVGAVSGIGGALIGSMFGGVLGSVAGAAFGGVTGANAGVAAADAIWDKVASMFGSDEKAAQYGIAHAKAAQAGWQNFQFNGKTYPVTLKPQEAKPAVDALNAVKEGIVPAEKLDELTGWTQAAPKRATPQPKKPTFAELIKKSDDKRSALQRQKDGGKKNWFAEEEELEEASWINGVKQDDKELVWKQTGMSYEKAVEQYGKEHVRLGGKNKLGQQTVEVHVPLVAEAQNDYFKRRKDEEDRIAGTKAPAKRTPKQTDYEKKRKQQGVAEDSENYGGIQLSLEIEKDDEYVDDDDTDNQTIYVKATANGRELGHVLFTIDYDSQGMVLNPQDLEVEEKYRGQGVAETMYDYVKSKGYRIRRSGQQTDAGAAFWNKHKPGQNVWEQDEQIQDVAENEKIGDKYEPEEFDAMISRLKKLAGQGELKTVWDPVKRVYKNVPINQDNK